MSDIFESVGSIILIVFIILLSKSRRKKIRKSSSSYSSSRSDSKKLTEKKLREEAGNLGGKVHDSGHTHDRLDLDCYNPSESEAEHYKKQLDSFLKAGLIEKSEYKELFRRYIGKQ
ncbi:MAG: hypothetical protein Q4F31_00850 [Eubacteriales bacterium]|nr:hypothetical protein [Eubacteriales bacterium]